MAVTNYVTLQLIRKQAGFQFTVKGETPTGTVDGANKVFTALVVAQSVAQPFVDQTADDVVDVNDVNVYDNGVQVATSGYTISSTKGTVTFVTAPLSGHVVTLDYSWSPISDADATTARQDARSLMDGYIGQIYAMPVATPANVPLLEQINKELAAAALLIQNYGVTGTNTSADGYKLRDNNMALLKALAAQQAELLDINGAGVPKNAQVTPDYSNVFPSTTSINEKGELFSTADEKFVLLDPARTSNPSGTPTFSQNLQGP